MKRRLLLITPSLQLPSDSSQLRLLIAGLADEQFDVHIAAICDPVGSPAGISNVTVHSLGIGRPQERRWSPHHAVALARAIRELLQSLRPDIVHSWDANARLEIAWASKNFPSIDRVETISSIGMPHSHVRQLIRNRIAPHEASVVVPHQSLIEHLVDDGCPEEQIVVIPPAVSLDQTSSRIDAKRNLTEHLGLPDSIYLATTFAPLQPRFRLKDLVWATDLLTCIRDDFHLLIVGRGKQKTRLRKFASQTEAGSHVHILDSSPENLTASDLFLGSDVCWNANLNTPLPSPMLHSMAGGTPAISVLGSGTSDLIRHQETGFAVNFGARDEFARWTKYLIEQVEAANQLCLQGQSFAQGDFALKDMIQAYGELYDGRQNSSANKSASLNPTVKR